MAGTPYKKDWIVSTRIARGLISLPLGARVPTINEYCETFACSRGVVQNALASLGESGAILLSKRGKQGTYLVEKNEDKLFENAGMSFLTGSMPTPLNMHLSGLATGICQSMSHCRIPFTFAFIQGAQNRMEALRREVYDFVVVSKAAAISYMAEHPQVEIAFGLEGALYALPYYIYFQSKGITELQSGMFIAADPTSPDQWLLTQLMCEGHGVNIVEMPYIPTVQAFKAAQVDSVILRGEHLQPREEQLVTGLESKAEFDLGRVGWARITLPEAEDMQAPVVMVNKHNYGITGILRSYLGGQNVGQIQQKVLGRQMPPQFF